MALLLQPYTTEQGFSVDNGYFEITDISYNLASKMFKFSGGIYISKEAKDNGFAPESTLFDRVIIEEDPANLIEYAYNYIKEVANGNSESTVVAFHPEYAKFIGCVDYEDEPKVEDVK